MLQGNIGASFCIYIYRWYLCYRYSSGTLNLKQDHFTDYIWCRFCVSCTDLELDWSQFLLVTVHLARTRFLLPAPNFNKTMLNVTIFTMLLCHVLTLLILFYSIRHRSFCFRDVLLFVTFFHLWAVWHSRFNWTFTTWFESELRPTFIGVFVNNFRLHWASVAAFLLIQVNRH